MNSVIISSNDCIEKIFLDRKNGLRCRGRKDEERKGGREEAGLHP